VAPSAKVPCTCRKVWLMPAAEVPCSNAANVGERKTLTRSEFCTWKNSVTGQEPQKCIYCTSPGDGQTSCKVWLASGERRRCSNEAKMRNPLKFAGVPQTPEPISAASGPQFAILWEHWEEILLFNKFFLTVNTCLSCKDSARQSCAMLRRWRFLRPVFPVSCVQHISDLHSKYALRPHQ